MTEQPQLQYVMDGICEPAQTFLRLGKPYMDEVDNEQALDHDRFLQSILRRQGEPGRWLALFMLGSEAVGFAHFKVDKDDRPGYGYIMEFYVIPERRRQGFGRHCVSQIAGILSQAGCSMAWLASHPAADEFWHACGFGELGEMERNKKILVAAMPFIHSQTIKERT